MKLRTLLPLAFLCLCVNLSFPALATTNSDAPASGAITSDATVSDVQAQSADSQAEEVCISPAAADQLREMLGLLDPGSAVQLADAECLSYCWSALAQCIHACGSGNPACTNACLAEKEECDSACGRSSFTQNT